MNSYRSALAAAIQALELSALTSHSWFGKRMRFDAQTRRALGHEGVRDYAIAVLRQRLYNDFYCPGFARPELPPTPEHHSIDTTEFLVSLSEANTGRGGWGGNWKVHSFEGASVVVEANGLRVWANPTDLDPAQGKAVRGRRVRLATPKEYRWASPGYYTAIGDTDSWEPKAGPALRFYWHIQSHGAPRLVSLLTRALNDIGVPFRFKVLSNPAAYRRCDSAVLYVAKARFQPVSEKLQLVYSGVRDLLLPETPALTRTLAPGLGLAEDPIDGESFGMSRCAIVAKALVEAFEQGRHSTADRIEQVESNFANGGVNLDAPYLNRGSSDDYQWRGDGEQTSRRTAVSNRSAISYLETAARIGWRLTDRAIHAGPQCNWLGVGAGVKHDESLPYGSLGCDLYNGTAGIGLFLAMLARETGERRFRSTALAALRNATENLHRVPARLRAGYYSGWAGIADAAIRAGGLLDSDELTGKGFDVFRRIGGLTRFSDETDLMAGLAGAVAALSRCWSMLDDRLRTRTIQLGHRIVSRSVESQAGLSWASTAHRGRRHLTGLSHGAAGIGSSLAGLFLVTQDARFREAAIRAFEYEQRWFDSDCGNWRDFREEPGYERSSAPRFATTWCHGAPGIALSRLWALRIPGSTRFGEAAAVALDTTRKSLNNSGPANAWNYSLCHGLAGNADVLLHAGLGQIRDPVALRVADEGIERYESVGRTWPCGAGAGETPGLMVGEAGIGYFYLRVNGLRSSVLFPFDLG